MESIPLSAPGAYLSAPVLGGTPGNYTITLQSALKNTGQHVHLEARDATGWTFALISNAFVNVEAGGSVTFTFDAKPAEGAAPLALDIVTDVGGRITVTVLPDGSLESGEAKFVPIAAAKGSPGAGIVLVLGVLGLAAMARKR